METCFSNPCAAIRKRSVEFGLSHHAFLEDEIEKAARVSEAAAFLQTHEDPPFHGYFSAEAFLNVFSEFGLTTENKLYKKLLERIVCTGPEDAFYEKGLSKVGRILEEKGHSGVHTIRAAVLVHADRTLQSMVRNEIAHSVEVFSRVNTYRALDDFAYKRKDTWVYKDGALFPDYYNLKLLAFSDIWRTKENTVHVRQAIRRLKELEPIPAVYIYERGQKIAPGSYLMHEFDTSFFGSDDSKKAEWLVRAEYMARLGVLDELGTVLGEIGTEPEKIMRSPIQNTYSFMKWGAYSGVALEDNWRSGARRVNDLLFRILLIRHCHENHDRHER